MLPLNHLLAMDRALDTPRQRARVAAQRAARRRRTGRFARFAILPFAVAGAWSGIVYDISQDGALREEAAAFLGLPHRAGKSDADVTIISTPRSPSRFKIEASAWGTVSPIRLSLASSGGPAGPPFALKLMGLPESFSLTRGFRESAGSWVLPPGEERDVALIAPVVPPEPVVLTVAAVAMETGEIKSRLAEFKVRIVPSAGQADHGGKIESRIRVVAGD